MWLVNARDVKNVPGRPKTDKLDSVWLCKLNERGMLRPSFVPPEEIRDLRALTRLRDTLTAECSRHKQRTEKILEDALLTELREEVSQLSGRALAGVCTFPAHDRNGRSSAGSGVAGGVAAGVA